METKKPAFWWIKTPEKQLDESDKPIVPKLDLKNLHPSTSFTDILEQNSASKHGDPDIDVGSIIEEINRVAAQSPLGPFESSIAERSIDDIMKEAEKVYMESSKSFEQLSQRSKTSQNISELLSSNSKTSTPTPKSLSPLPMDPVDKYDSSSDYSDDFSQNSKSESDKLSTGSQKLDTLCKALKEIDNDKDTLVISKSKSYDETSDTLPNSPRAAKSTSLVKRSFKLPMSATSISPRQSFKNSPFMSTRTSPEKSPRTLHSPVMNLNASLAESQLKIAQPPDKSIIEPFNVPEDSKKIRQLSEEIEFRNKLIKTLEDDNGILRKDIQEMKCDLQNTQSLIERLKTELNTKTLSSPEINLELEKALEEVKDCKEINTSLQLQLETANKTHHHLKSSYDDLVSSNKNLERKVVELEATLAKYKAELINIQQAKAKLIENETNLKKLLDIEKLQGKSLRLQNEKDSKCIQDLNRQIKEMERIIARKHPDSVSALIVAAKENATDTNLTARKLLEDRIKTLEQEVTSRDLQSSKVFMEIQEKFNQMKNKYESHIEDLELHVSDLKNQMKKKTDTYDVYTQTFFKGKIPEKESFTIGVQTEAAAHKIKFAPVGRNKAPEKDNHKEDAHLLATIRGLQTDLSNKEKAILKLHKEIEELRKTNKRLQKEREGSLRNLSERKDFRSYPEKLVAYSRSGSVQDFRKEEALQQLKLERDKVKQQLARLEEEYQNLKKKRLDDLTALQDAHEREISNYVSSVTPLREQLEMQQVSVKTLQSHLTKAKEELAICGGAALGDGAGDRKEADVLLKKISNLEKHYEEREYRLRAIVQSLAQKSITNRSCDQCAERQQQLIGYKVELDQLLATVRALK
ncbi:centrosomal protein of 162 kDa isoform X2 [Dendroctonus ponderosae]|uniref:centrosomal protein of 162 kDa isoform X2 n=1 Tax=Dendroctonus ponderosae TaxID=77166 RepID=UPI002035A08C|nr:centrosomal protein of 162 kDa isoform X2 [Dendroctonus ponderosae]